MANRKNKLKVAVWKANFEGKVGHNEEDLTRVKALAG